MNGYNTITTKVIVLSIVCFCLLAGNIAHGQYLRDKGDKEFANLNYSYALNYYMKVTDKRTADYELAKKIGMCYMMMGNSTNAEIWFAKAIAHPQVQNEVYLYYAEALRNNGNYSEARRQFLIYGIKNTEDRERAEYYAFACEMAMEWMVNPIQIKVSNRTDLNTEYSEFSPVFKNQELFFTTDRKLTTEDYSKKQIYGWTGSPYLFLMSSEYTDSNEVFTVKNKINDIDNYYHNGPACFSSDGKTMYFTRSNKLSNSKKTKGAKDIVNRLEIYSATLKNNQWVDIKPFQYNDAKQYSVGHPALSPDGKILYFVSDMTGSKGETDIYFSTKDSNGSWAPPINAGSKINSAGKELFPYVSQDGTLYFSSNGHSGMGGLDIFSAKGSGRYWNEVKNMQFPINSPKDDFGITLDSTGNSGFFSSNREGGKGGDDIYHFSNPVCVLAGLTLEFKDGGEKPLEDVMVSLYKKGDTSSIIAYERSSTAHSKRVCLRTYQPCALINNAKGTFFFNLQPGTYEVKASKNGYFTHISTVDINCEKNDTVKLALELKKIELNKAVVLKDLFYDDKDELYVKKRIYYDLDKSDIRYDAALELDKLIELLKNNPNIKIELGSHTDSRHSTEYNKALSQRRAESAVNYIVKKGISKDRIVAKGYGEEKLVNECKDDVNCPEEKHQDNRRTEIMVTEIIEPKEHLVGPYDTLHSISRKYNISVEELKDINNLTDDIIYAGDVIKLKK